MNIHEMTEEECRAMLSRRNVVRLACALNNQPYIVPIHIDLRGLPLRLRHAGSKNRLDAAESPGLSRE